MNSIELNNLLKLDPKTKKIFCGVIPINHLPQQMKKPCSLIINTQECYLPGQHWLAIYINEDGRGFYFDSFGGPPKNKLIKEFLIKNCNLITYNNNQIQNINSNTCGIYCLLFIRYIANGLPFNKFINLFSLNTLNNDKIINKLYKLFYK